MLVVQSRIKTGIIHHVKLLRSGNGDWNTKEINIIEDNEGKVTDIR